MAYPTPLYDPIPCNSPHWSLNSSSSRLPACPWTLQVYLLRAFELVFASLDCSLMPSVVGEAIPNPHLKWQLCHPRHVICLYVCFFMTYFPYSNLSSMGSLLVSHEWFLTRTIHNMILLQSEILNSGVAETDNANYPLLHVEVRGKNT